MSLQKIISGLARAGSESVLKSLVDYIGTHETTNEEVAQLAVALAESGTILSLPPSVKAADIPSTGGPTSLSTLACPLFLLHFGYSVPKLAVPGRPAGGVDVMAQIPGYRIELSQRDVARVLGECGYAHFLTTKDYAPLDGELFAYRKNVGAVDVPALVIASLLSKKIAVNLKRVGLDVRVAPHANFGGTWLESRANARRFCAVAKLVDIDAVCFLTDASKPYQPYVGRGEALLALAKIVQGQQDSWLEQHTRTCFAMACLLAQADALPYPDHRRLMQHFAANLRAQGSNVEAFLDTVDRVLRTPRREINAARSGFLVIDLGQLRRPLVALQESHTTNELPYPDPAGVILVKNTGDYVLQGEVLATVRCSNADWPVIESEILDAFDVEPNPGISIDFEEVRDA